jgi:Synaptobrevin
VLLGDICCHATADMASMSSALVEESKKYQRGAEKLYRSAVFKKYLPFIVVGAVILLIIMFRWLYSK